MDACFYQLCRKLQWKTGQDRFIRNIPSTSMWMMGKRKNSKRDSILRQRPDDAEFWVNGQADLVVKTFAMAEENITTKLIHLYM